MTTVCATSIRSETLTRAAWVQLARCQKRRRIHVRRAEGSPGASLPGLLVLRVGLVAQRPVSRVRCLPDLRFALCHLVTVRPQ